MFQYVWTSGCLGIGCFVLFLVFLFINMKKNQNNGTMSLMKIVPNLGLLLVSIGWFVMALMLYLNIQNQILN